MQTPPFNDSDWSGELLRDDARWKVLGEKLTPPTGNANYAWIQHFLYHLAPTGQAGFVLSKGALTTNTTGEGEIRKALVEKGFVDCIVNLPTKLFLNTQIPACLWFLGRNRQGREKEILFIDARNMGFLINRKNRDLTEEDIQLITNTYRNWKNRLNHDSSNLENQGNQTNQKNHSSDNYQDVAGFCKVATIEEVAKLNYVLTPGRYVGLADEDDDFDFVERFNLLKTELEKQIAEEADLNKKIAENISKIILPKSI